MEKEIHEGTVPRPPIVVVVGHVDHGKTTLLDYIRKTDVAASEAGGITQAIGAYEAEHGGRKITFIDTPGHEAFIGMRTRGARIADLAILVIAADEGVKPQTEEAIQTLKETKTPFIVAINKIDANGADIDRIKNELSARSVLLEGYGGDVSYQPISAKTGKGVSDLLDLLLLAADVEGFSYSPLSPANGFVLEARMNRRRGIEAALIVRDGILHLGENIRTETTEGKIKILEDFLGNAMEEIYAGSPACVVGFKKMPETGEAFSSVEGEIVETKTEPTGKKTADRFSPDEIAKNGSLNVIMKAGDAGSLEALRAVVAAMQFEKLVIIVDSGVGEINEGDVKFAISTDAVIIGFKSEADKAAQALARAHDVAIVTSSVVYELVTAIETFIAQSKTAIVVGMLEVLATFNQKRLDKQLVGGRVVKGTFPNRGTFHIERGEKRIGEGRIASVESGKKEAQSVAAGSEAGVILGSREKIEVGDVLVAEKERKAT